MSGWSGRDNPRLGKPNAGRVACLLTRVSRVQDAGGHGASHFTGADMVLLVGRLQSFWGRTHASTMSATSISA